MQPGAVRRCSRAARTTGRRAGRRVVAELVTRFFAEEGFTTSADEVRSRVLPFVAEPANAAFLAFDGDGAVGIATLTTAYGFETGRYGEIEELYVVPSHRRRGVARALVEAALAEAARLGCHDTGRRVLDRA